MWCGEVKCKKQDTRQTTRDGFFMGIRGGLGKGVSGKKMEKMTVFFFFFSLKCEEQTWSKWRRRKGSC